MADLEGLGRFAAVRVALGQRVADAKFLSAGRRNRGEREDSEAMVGGGDTVDVVPAVFHLTYEDSGGFQSERVVTVRRIERRSSGAFFLHGVCHLRQAPRCFNVERIVECFDITTGEFFGDPARYFSEHPLYTDPREPEQEAIKLCRHELNLLTVIGASDGLFDPDEQDVVLLHVFDRCDHLKMDERRVRNLLAFMAPDQAAFDGSLFQMHRFKAGDPKALRRSMRRLVDADGQLHAAEVHFVQEIEQHLGLRAGV